MLLYIRVLHLFARSLGGTLHAILQVVLRGLQFAAFESGSLCGFTLMDGDLNPFTP